MADPAAKQRLTRRDIGRATAEFLSGFSICLILAAGAAFGLDRAFPPDLSRYQAASPTVAAHDGRLLRAYLSDDQAWRFPVTHADVSPLYLEMLIAVEDGKYRRHAGVDPFAIVRAGYDAVSRGRIVSGASTLTMQVARLLEPRRRTVGAKLIEMARALQLEWRYSKDEILDIYLTLAPFGGNLEGVRAASLAWLGKEPRHLTPGEAALFVALPQAPNAFRPDRAPERVTARRNQILTLAADRDVLSEQRADEARNEPVPNRRRDMPLIAGIATDRVLAASLNTNAISTLRYDLQVGSERVIGGTADLLGPGTGASAIVADIHSGDVLALVGSAAYLEAGRAGMVDQTRAIRSPGSALKPFIYGMAFDGLLAHPETVIADRPRRFGAFAPVNFDRGWSGDVSLHDALRLSLNGPAVALLDRLGPGRLLDRLVSTGTPLVMPEGNGSPGLAIALGGVGTTLEDLVTLYAAIARGGDVMPLRLTDLEPTELPGPIMGQAAAWYVAQSLNETPRPLAYRSDGHRDGRRIAFKTGTSHGYRDGWAIGFSGDFVVGVWIGRPDGAPCPGCSGIGSAAPAMFRLFDLLPRDLQPSLAVAAPPVGAIFGGPAALPARIRRFDADRRAGSAGSAHATDPPRIDFPLDGTEVLLAPALPLRVTGGSAPYRVLVDNMPLSAPLGRGAAVWNPDGPGTSTLTVVDAEGRTARSRVEILAP